MSWEGLPLPFLPPEVSRHVKIEPSFFADLDNAGELECGFQRRSATPQYGAFWFVFDTQWPNPLYSFTQKAGSYHRVTLFHYMCLLPVAVYHELEKRAYSVLADFLLVFFDSTSWLILSGKARTLPSISKSLSITQ